MEGSIQRVGIFLYIESYIICHNNLAGMRKKRPNLQKVLGGVEKVTYAGEARRLREKFVQFAVSLGKWIGFK